MLAIDKKILTFDIKEVHFSDKPYDIENCDYLKFCYCKDKVNLNGFTRKKEFTNIIDLTQDLESIWEKMDRKNTRYWINRAEKEGIKIRINEGYEQFYQIFRLFMKKKGIKSLFNIFGVGKISLKAMKQNGTLFVAEYDGEILAGTIFLENDTHIEAWIGASKRLEVDKKKKAIVSCANRLIDWKAIKYAKEKGIKEYDLGGLWPEEEAEKDISKKGINNFKLSFGGKTVTRYSYEKTYSKTYRFFYNLYDLKNSRKKATQC